ncbi:nickel-binding protein [Neptuniibacter halophilus]|uniref:nickel-binding protein n=1 Tax=Neptuniibacter halophilus TaxID=651666 RepID=UPI002573A327|nr:nickel-binding protein [Neptuniibacter halophilus]
MPKFIIERDIPEIGSADQAALSAAAEKSNSVLSAMQAEQKAIEWQHSYVAGDKTYCVYECASEDLIHEHARRSGFPASTVTEVRNQIDPSTADR